MDGGLITARVIPAPQGPLIIHSNGWRPMLYFSESVIVSAGEPYSTVSLTKRFRTQLEIEVCALRIVFDKRIVIDTQPLSKAKRIMYPGSIDSVDRWEVYY